MTAESLIQTADVDVLKCVFFQLVKSWKEIGWYGLDCSLEEYENNIDMAFSYLKILETGCVLTHQLQCEILKFIKKLSSFCIFSSFKCPAKYTTASQVWIITESSDPILTENDLNLIIE